MVSESFCENWVLQLSRDDKVFLALFLTFQLSNYFDCGTTRAAELAGTMVGRSDRVVREWRSQFFSNGGCIPESEQGKYERSGVVWCNFITILEKLGTTCLPIWKAYQVVPSWRL